MSKNRTNTEKLYDVIKKPLITEKTVAGSALGKYTFEVRKARAANASSRILDPT